MFLCVPGLVFIEEEGKACFHDLDAKSVWPVSVDLSAAAAGDGSGGGGDGDDDGDGGDDAVTTLL